MNQRERRLWLRVPSDFQVDYHCDGNYLISSTLNISVDGMFICTESPPPPGTQLTLLFSIDQGDPQEAAALVVWTARSPQAPANGMGVQFLSPLPDPLKLELLKNSRRLTMFEQQDHNA